MAHANLDVTVTEKTTVKKSNAAAYTGSPAKYFGSVCPVRPIEPLLELMSLENTVWTFDVKAWLEAETKRYLPSQSAKIVSCLRAEMSKCSQSHTNERSA